MLLVARGLSAQGPPAAVRELGDVVRARVNVRGLADTVWLSGSPVTTAEGCAMIRLDHVGWWEGRLVITDDLPADERVQVPIHFIRQLQVPVGGDPGAGWLEADLPWLRSRDPRICRIRARAGGP